MQLSSKSDKFPSRKKLKTSICSRIFYRPQPPKNSPISTNDTSPNSDFQDESDDVTPIKIGQIPGSDQFSRTINYEKKTTDRIDFIQAITDTPFRVICYMRTISVWQKKTTDSIDFIHAITDTPFGVIRYMRAISVKKKNLIKILTCKVFIKKNSHTREFN